MNKMMILSVLFFIIPATLAIDGAIDCKVNTDCVLGEYVFSDEYVPISTQICNLTVYYPNGTISLNNTPMTANEGGWHNYTLNYATTGLYKAYMDCNGTYFEKSFYVNTESDDTEGLQECYVSTDCIIGEYVYNDTYSPLSTQICNLTVYYPNGTISLNNTPMTANEDGWHNYTLIYDTNGLYNSYMVCGDNGDVGYLDKSFYIINEATVSEGYTGRTNTFESEPKGMLESIKETIVIETTDNLKDNLNTGLFIIIILGVGFMVYQSLNKKNKKEKKDKKNKDLMEISRW